MHTNDVLVIPNAPQPSGKYAGDGEKKYLFPLPNLRLRSLFWDLSLSIPALSFKTHFLFSHCLLLVERHTYRNLVTIDDTRIGFVLCQTKYGKVEQPVPGNRCNINM